jgi:hypothetical protein
VLEVEPPPVDPPIAFDVNVPCVLPPVALLALVVLGVIPAVFEEVTDPVVPPPPCVFLPSLLPHAMGTTTISQDAIETEESLERNIESPVVEGYGYRDGPSSGDFTR